MGTIHLIAKQRDGEEVILFEGRHSIPFFWLMLLSEDDVAAYREKTSRISTDNVDPTDTQICLDKLKALSKAAGRRNYVKRHFPTRLPLYDDWLYFMQTADFSDMKIYLDLHSVSLNPVDREQLIGGLQKALVWFDENREAWYENTLAGTCGYEGRNKNKKRFGTLSKAYQSLNTQVSYDNRPYFRKTKSSGKRIKRMLWILILIALLVGGGIYFLNRYLCAV